MKAGRSGGHAVRGAHRAHRRSRRAATGRRAVLRALVWPSEPVGRAGGRIDACAALRERRSDLHVAAAIVLFALLSPAQARWTPMRTVVVVRVVRALARSHATTTTTTTRTDAERRRATPSDDRPTTDRRPTDTSSRQHARTNSATPVPTRTAGRLGPVTASPPSPAQRVDVGRRERRGAAQTPRRHHQRRHRATATATASTGRVVAWRHGSHRRRVSPTSPRPRQQRSPLRLRRPNPAAPSRTGARP